MSLLRPARGSPDSSPKVMRFRDSRKHSRRRWRWIPVIYCVRVVSTRSYRRGKCSFYRCERSEALVSSLLFYSGSVHSPMIYWLGKWQDLKATSASVVHSWILKYMRYNPHLALQWRSACHSRDFFRPWLTWLQDARCLISARKMETILLATQSDLWLLKLESIAALWGNEMWLTCP